MGTGSLDTSLVRIRKRDGYVVGAGFMVGKRHVLTCAHVIVQALDIPDTISDIPSSEVRLDFAQLGSQTLMARVVFWCPIQNDIAGLVLLDEPPVGAEGVCFASADHVWEHRFRVLGFPSGYDDGIWATGRLLGHQWSKWLQLEDIKVPGFSVISGFSGAPVWDEQLCGVVGMIIASTSQAATTKTAFAIPSDVLLTSWPQLATLMLPSIPRNPYKGLQAFTENDVRDFFGRDALLDELITVIKDVLLYEQERKQHARLLTLIGASGSGKSSVLMAGLIPYLQAGKIPYSDQWVYLNRMVPGTDPLQELIITLKQHFPDTSFKQLREDLENGEYMGLHLLATQLVGKSKTKVILQVDQFEEIFTLTTDEAKRQQFIKLLVSAATEPRGPLFVILTLRADFYDQPMQYAELYRLIDAHHVSVFPLERDSLRSVIEQPANLPEVQLTFERGLVEELLFAMHGQNEALPLLEFTLDQLVRQRDRHLLTLQAYQEMGGLKGALFKHAEETYQKLPSEEHRQMARGVFLRLLIPGTCAQDTMRRRADLSEFHRADPVQTLRIQETMEKFTSERLLTINQNNGNTTIEVSHEALIREWKRLADWLSKAQEDILFQQSLSEDAKAWEQHKRPRSRLYRGAQLKEAQAWTRRNEPSEREMIFLWASKTQRALSSISLIMVCCLLLSSIGIAGWFVFTQPPDPTLVTTLQDGVNGSLRYCVDRAPSGSVIRFADSLKGIIKLTRGDLVFGNSKRLTIIGSGANQLTISGNNTGAIIHVSQNTTLNISGLSFKNGRTFINAFLYNEGRLTVTNSIFSDNKTTVNTNVPAFGGGIENGGAATLTVINSTFSDNSVSGSLQAAGHGGGIYNDGKLTVINSIFSDNTVSNNNNSHGGAIFNSSSGTTSVTNSIFSNNVANGKQLGQGGGIDNDGKLTMTNSTLSNNKAIGDNSYGGSIFNSSIDTAKIIHSTFSNNSSSGKQFGQGGGIENMGNLAVATSTLSNNRASGNISYGGGIDNYTTGITIVTSSTFSNNITSGKQVGQGGGIDNNGKFSITTSTLSNNRVSGSDSNGGGITNASTGTIVVTSSTFSNNSSDSKQFSQGGGINNDGKLSITTSMLSNNRVSGNHSHGGGIYNYTTGTTVVIGSTFSNNVANGKQVTQGGGIDNSGKLIMVTSTISNNRAIGVNNSGGGIESSGFKDSSTIIRFSTIYDNMANTGGGIWLNPTGSSHVTISGSIVAANNAQNGPDVSGLLNSDGYNLFQNVTGVSGLNATTDRAISLSNLKIDSTLRNNGGHTQTLALLPESAAINVVPRQSCSITITDISGHTMTITTDQRGYPRPGGSKNACDSGAYESSYQG